MNDLELYSELTERFAYCNITGVFFYKKHRIKNKIGTKVVTKGHHGYIVLSYKKKKIYAHRLAFWILHQYLPPVIDHINGVKSDNRPCNLVDSTQTANCHNKPKKKGCSSNFIGVAWHRQRKKWRAEIKFNTKSYFLGLFDNEAQAAEAYNKKALEFYGLQARINDTKEWSHG